MRTPRNIQWTYMRLVFRAELARLLRDEQSAALQDAKAVGIARVAELQWEEDLRILLAPCARLAALRYYHGDTDAFSATLVRADYDRGSRRCEDARQLCLVERDNET